MKRLELPRAPGTTKSPSVREKVKIAPAARPGMARGSVTWRNVWAGRAPRSAEASRHERGTRSRAAATGSTM
jgi:hypothetical protein